ncbi:hypothetical protein Ciccas_006926 [Cichlidogyrus casuarinus]|uniref:Uncharacterized protein n=1 Tax=Cichlidogyrus casuarinus TaxID=1844966 RepID=A0ABD2Q5F4_9PLAT
MADFQETFLAFCDSTKKGSTTATDKTLKKMLTDAKILDKKMTQNDADIEFRKFLGNSKKDVNCADFKKFISEVFAPAYAKRHSIDASNAEQKILEKLEKASPKGHGTTSASKDGATSRLTDVSKYTGAHKERFDAETGKGKGIEGREDVHANDGYVGNYKGKETYDEKH